MNINWSISPDGILANKHLRIYNLYQVNIKLYSTVFNYLRYLKQDIVIFCFLFTSFDSANAFDVQAAKSKNKKIHNIIYTIYNHIPLKFTPHIMGRYVLLLTYSL